nr:helix-turn-helix domain-containing protein [Photobacterium phosphoreum]
MGVKHLTSEDRFYIEKRRIDNTSMRTIAKELGCSPSTISREVKRNTPDDFLGLYSHRAATNLSKKDGQKQVKTRHSKLLMPLLALLFESD